MRRIAIIDAIASQKMMKKIENNEQERERKKVEDQIVTDIEEHDECKEEEETDWQEKFFQLRKTQKQMEEHTIEIEAKLRKKEKQIEEKEEEDFFYRRKHVF